MSVPIVFVVNELNTIHNIDELDYVGVVEQFHHWEFLEDLLPIESCFSEDLQSDLKARGIESSLDDSWCPVTKLTYNDELPEVLTLL